MHSEILTEEQNKLLPLVAEFSKNFYLVGGAAVALHLGQGAGFSFSGDKPQHQLIKEMRRKLFKSCGDCLF